VPRTPKVLIETSRVAVILRESFIFAADGPWGFYVTPGDFEQVLPACGPGAARNIANRVSKWPGSCVRLPTTRWISEDQLRHDHRLSRRGCPTRAGRRMAAEHLLERGFRHYAFVGVRGRVWSDCRRRRFAPGFARRALNPTSTAHPPRGLTSGARG
jgi:hypothetical protein